MTVTADSTLWTADTLCVTADGRVICIAADVVEPIHGSITADSTIYTADSTLQTADGSGVVGATDSLDAVVVAASGVVSVDEAANALDQLDATVDAAVVSIPGGTYYRPPLRPREIVGVGFGILPQLVGEARGVVVVVGNGVGLLPGLVGEASGSAGVAGRSAGHLLVRATATGAPGTRGSGVGMIVKFSGAAIGQQVDDEGAVIAFLLAA